MQGLRDLHFIHAAWLWLLLLIPLMWGGYWWRRKQQGRGQWEQFIDPQLLPFVLQGKAAHLSGWTLGTVSGALLVAVVAMAGPSWEKQEIPVFRNQQALVIAMDFSASMQAEDAKPDRLTLARFKLLDLFKARPDGQTGLVVFAGDAFVVSPLTDDVETIQEQIKNLSPSLMPASGSHVAPAIERSMDLLKQASARAGHILVITDGASDAEAAVQAAAQAKQAGYNVSVLAIGSAEGAPVPQRNGGFVQDRNGQTVVAKVDLATLEHIAQSGAGTFVQASADDGDVTILTKQWLNVNADSPALRDGQGRQVDTWVNEGYWLILLLLPVAALAFRRGWLGAVLVCFVLPQPQSANAMGWHDLWQTPDQQAQAAFDNRHFNDAAKLFQDPTWKAAAAYESGDYATAANLFSAQPTLEAQYNYGNALARQGKYQEAITAYDKVLATNPQHADALYNKDVVKKALEQQKQQQNQQQDNQNNQQEQKDQQNQQNQQQQNQQGGQQNPQAQKDQQQQQNQQQQNQKDQQNQQQNAQKDQQEQKDQQAQEQTAKQQQAQAEKAEKDQQQQAEADPQQREQQQATEQWLNRIPDDPAGLWRRKFQYQYQQRGSQAAGEAW